MQENGDDSFSEINRVEPGMNGGWIQIAGPVEGAGPPVHAPGGRVPRPRARLDVGGRPRRLSFAGAATPVAQGGYLFRLDTGNGEGAQHLGGEVDPAPRPSTGSTPTGNSVDLHDTVGTNGNRGQVRGRRTFGSRTEEATRGW